MNLSSAFYGNKSSQGKGVGANRPLKQKAKSCDAATVHHALQSLGVTQNSAKIVSPEVFSFSPSLSRGITDIIANSSIFIFVK